MGREGDSRIPICVTVDEREITVKQSLKYAIDIFRLYVN